MAKGKYKPSSRITPSIIPAENPRSRCLFSVGKVYSLTLPEETSPRSFYCNRVSSGEIEFYGMGKKQFSIMRVRAPLDDIYPTSSHNYSLGSRTSIDTFLAGSTENAVATRIVKSAKLADKF